MRALLAALALLLVASLSTSTARAATGDTLREITAANPQSCSPFNVGVAFDGNDLLVSCVGNNIIDRIDPSGSLVGQITVTGETIIGALSYDRSRGKLWACTFGGAERVMLIDPADGSVDAEFASNGCGDGLGYDGDDDTLWAGADQVCDVTHYQTDGTVIDAFNACPLIGGSGKSGIAVGGGKLYIANPNLSRVYQVERDFSASSLLFQTDRFLEDLECDDVTFAPKSAMWVQAAYDRILTAIEIPAGACPFGGDPPQQVDLSVTKSDSPDPVAIGGQLTYTVTVRNNGPADATGVALTDNLSAGVSFVSATPSKGSCSQTSGTVSCDIGSLANGEAATVEIKVTPQTGGSITNGVSVTASESDSIPADNTATETTTVTANRPPDCSKVKPNPGRLWPPNHKFHLVTIGGATDPDGDPVTVAITGVTQDESVNGKGDGNTSPDARPGPASNQVYLRFERSGKGDGRVYRISFTGSDGRGGTCSGHVEVGVPHDMGKKGSPKDSGGNFNSFRLGN